MTGISTESQEQAKAKVQETQSDQVPQAASPSTGTAKSKRPEKKYPRSWDEAAPTLTKWCTGVKRVVGLWVWPLLPNKEYVEIFFVAAACIISYAQWQKIGDNDTTTARTLQALRTTADQTAEIARQLKAGSEIMQTQLRIARTLAEARIKVKYDPFVPESGRLRLWLSNEGDTTAKEATVFASPEWYGEPPLGLVSMNPPPPFDIESRGAPIPYPVVFSGSVTADGRKIPPFGAMRAGYKLRIWYSVQWFNIFGEWSQTIGCFSWIDAKTWERCEPPKEIDWVRIYRQNGASEEDAKIQAERTREYQRAQKERFRGRDFIH